MAVPNLPDGWTQVPPQTNSNARNAYYKNVPDPNNPGKELKLYIILDNNNQVKEYTLYNEDKSPVLSVIGKGDPQAPGLTKDQIDKIKNLAENENKVFTDATGATPLPALQAPIETETQGNIIENTIIEILNNLGFNNYLLPKELKIIQFGSVDEAIKKMPKPLNYPFDALYKNTQDHLRISQYKYHPPSANAIFGDPKEILGTGVQRKSPIILEELLGIVNLPMPNNISDSNNVSWADDNMNNLSAAFASYVADKPLLTAAGVGALAAGAGVAQIPQSLAQVASIIAVLKSMGIDKADPTTDPNIKTIVGSAINSRILSALGFSVSPETILARGFGIVPNSNLELLFNAPTLREFSFQYRLSPRGISEAKNINNIIRFFKQGMAAKKQNSTSGAGSASYFLGTPNVFKLNYKTTGDKDIKGVNRIKVCALTGFSVNYAADGNWSAYDDGQPVSSIINMSFKELEPIYDTDYQKTVDPNRTDLDPVQDDDVGY